MGLYIFSGPSCVGKGPIIRAIKTLYPQIALKEIGVIKSFESRGWDPKLGDLPEKYLRKTDNPHDFMTAENIRKLANDDNYIVGDCRGLPQAVSRPKIIEAVANNVDRHVYLEVYYTIAKQIIEKGFLNKVPGLSVKTGFISPVSIKELEDLKMSGADLNIYLNYLMMGKLLNRTRLMNEGSTATIIADRWSRARDAYFEIAMAHLCDVILVNHDAEGNPNWHEDLSYKDPDNTGKGMFLGGKMEGDAKRSVEAMVALFSGKTPEKIPGFEKWHKNPIILRD